jgi:tryptophan halogenase
MNNKKFKFVIVGGGTAGAIAASYLKTYWQDLVEVVLVYNHAEPNIGVGESLTPKIYNYLNYVGITAADLIKHTNSTVKIGIKFKNWLNDGSYFYHPFDAVDTSSGLGNFNFEAAHDLANNCYDHDTTYSKQMFEENRISTLSTASQALHIDGVLFSKFVLEKFKNKLTIVDDIVLDIVKKPDSEEIDYLITEKNKKIVGDFYIDASGFKNILFQKLKNNWIDKTDWLPLNRFIPNPVPANHKSLPVFTTAEASDEGWILQVPLQNRWGTGYLFSSNFLSNDAALTKFNHFLEKNFDTELKNDRVLSFKSGYWENQWVGNCICLGLSSGFAEPLEATNIHQAIFQLENFVDRFNFKLFNFDIDHYNQDMQKFYQRAYLFIRFCYTTNRTDSDFWKYMSNNVPYEVRSLEEKIIEDFLNTKSMPPDIFNYNNFFKIAAGLKKINGQNYKEILENRQAWHIAEHNSQVIKKLKDHMYVNSVDHLQYIKKTLKEYNQA